MSVPPPVVQAPGRVLSTLNVDGSRRWIRPVPSPGRFWRYRLVVAWALIAIFVVLPHLRIAGKPAILLDLGRWEFTFFGLTLYPTDTLLFMLFFISALIAIFLVTASLGRVWCGWACPQTVYLEYLFRPLERLVEGGFRGSRDIDRRGGWSARRLIKFGVYLPFAMLLAHTFLAYFVGTESLARWVRLSPVEHPGPFVVMLGTTGLMLFDFGWFREQTCLVACPYGRLQSVLLDRRSLIVGYDVRRGEPRAKGVKSRAAGAGDCIDCQMCVQTCPTGIDIREGLQMECLHCTQCMDACDAVMVKIGKPAGLIRYGSRDGFEGRTSGWLRPRTALYPLALAVTVGWFGWQLASRADADLTVLRGLGAPYTLTPAGEVSNQVRIKVANHARRDRAFRIEVLDAPDVRTVAPWNPIPVPAAQMRTASIFLLAPAASFTSGERFVTIRVSEGGGFGETTRWRLVGPQASPGREGDRP
jgi:cytochrome c oxidase accessory protein FixG